MVGNTLGGVRTMWRLDDWRQTYVMALIAGSSLVYQPPIIACFQSTWHEGRLHIVMALVMLGLVPLCFLVGDHDIKVLSSPGSQSSWVSLSQALVLGPRFWVQGPWFKVPGPRSWVSPSPTCRRWCWCIPPPPNPPSTRLPPSLPEI